MDAEAFLKDRSQLVDRWLERLLPPSSAAPQNLHQAMRHLLFPGGKRLRPALAMAASEALGASLESALPVAAAVELIHTYSLIHDDLPCMDDDVERRGRPTVHVQFGEATAVLAGDALLALAFEALSGIAAEAGPECLAAVVRDAARAAGSLGLVGGQVDDLAFDPGRADGAQVESIHQRKTAALFGLSVLAPARVASASQVELAQLEHFGRALGVAFQIADDLLDAGEGDGCSLLRVESAAAAGARADALLESALEQIENWGERAEPLRELARYAVRRNR